MATLQGPRGTASGLSSHPVFRAVVVIFGFFVFAHGLIHIMGFLVQWKLATIQGLDYRTTVLGGHVDLGSAGIRLEGLLWLPPILGFTIAAVGLVIGANWWRKLTTWTAVFSLAICILGWPQAQAGVYVNIAILVLLAVLALTRRQTVTT